MRLRPFLLALLAGLLWLAGGAVHARGLAVDGRERIDAWSAVTLLRDPTHSLGLQEALAQHNRFEVPAGTPKNLGVTTDAVWLRVPLQVGPDGAGAWIVVLDYPPLNRVDMHLLRDGRLVAQHALGNAMPFGERPLPSRGHAAPMTLEAGAGQELWLRVETASSMLLPLRLERPNVFHATESAMQLLLGLLLGISLCMAVYSLAQWAVLRDPLFLQYAITVIATSVFFLSYAGIGQQMLWPDSPGAAVRIAPLAVLVTAAAAAAFLRGSLDVRAIAPRTDRAIIGVGVLALTAAAAGLVGLLDYRAVQGLATALGPLLLVLTVPVAFRRARRGERVGTYMLVGWATYLGGVAVMAGLLRGYVEPGFWTLNLYQLSTTIEMAAWMAVLGVRVDEMRRAADRARLESDAMRSLAQTDPLTGLPNRRGLGLHLETALRGSAPGRAVAVYLIDLDGFKTVNDHLGHDVGDGLLQAVAQRLRLTLRGSDVVARLGGDEFVVVAAGLDSDEAARRLGQKMLESSREPYAVAGHPCEVGMTIGYALAPQDGLDAADLLKRADAAMYAGKQDGRRQLRRGGASPGWTGSSA